MKDQSTVVHAMTNRVGDILFCLGHVAPQDTGYVIFTFATGWQQVSALTSSDDVFALADKAIAAGEQIVGIAMAVSGELAALQARGMLCFASACDLTCRSTAFVPVDNEGMPEWMAIDAEMVESVGMAVAGLWAYLTDHDAAVIVEKSASKRTRQPVTA